MMMIMCIFDDDDDDNDDDDDASWCQFLMNLARKWRIGRGIPLLLSTPVRVIINMMSTITNSDDDFYDLDDENQTSSDTR